MKVVKDRRKWVIEGDGEGWIFKKRFPAKWKAEVALEVYKKEGKVSDYWKKAKEYAEKRPERIPRHAIERVERALAEISRLDPTCEEIEEYGENAPYGVLTGANNDEYFGPRFNNTWGKNVGDEFI